MIRAILFDDPEDGIRLDQRHDDELMLRCQYGNTCAVELRYLLTPAERADWQQRGSQSLRELVAAIRADERRFRDRELH
jgi:hypothetical protein